MTTVMGLRGRCGVNLFGIGVLCTMLAACGGGGGSSSSQAGTIGGVSTATLAWTAPNQDMTGACINVSAYQINYGTSADSLSQTATVQAGTVSCTNTGATNACGPIESCTYPIANLPAGTWYFAVQLTDTAGQQSGQSIIVTESLQ